MIKNHRHLILTNEKFIKKFSYDNIPTTTKLSESVAPPQTAILPKHVTSLTTINTSKPIAPNGTKVIRMCFEKTRQVYGTVLKYVD